MPYSGFCFAWSVMTYRNFHNPDYRMKVFAAWTECHSACGRSHTGGQNREMAVRTPTGIEISVYQRVH